MIVTSCCGVPTGNNDCSCCERKNVATEQLSEFYRCNDDTKDLLISGPIVNLRYNDDLGFFVWAVESKVEGDNDEYWLQAFHDCHATQVGGRTRAVRFCEAWGLVIRKVSYK